MNNLKLYGVIAILGVIVIIFWLISAWMGSLFIEPAWGPPFQTKISVDVSISSSNPLVLTANMSSISYTDIAIESGYIHDQNHTIVAECPRTVSFGSVTNHHGLWAEHFVVCVLTANSTKIVTLNFNTALSSGNYSLKFYTHGTVFYSNYFTIT